MQQYFADPKVAKLLRWHADREEKKREDDTNDPEIDKKDKMLSHPKDASQWQALNFEDLEFGNGPRNIVLGASTDGVNPFGSQRSTHSTWPVFVWMYNLPPWLCMKRKYIHMSMLIEGPKQPGNDINLYLGLLKEELDTLWKMPANTWRKHKDLFDGETEPRKCPCTRSGEEIDELLKIGKIAHCRERSKRRQSRERSKRRQSRC